MIDNNNYTVMNGSQGFPGFGSMGNESDYPFGNDYQPLPDSILAFLKMEKFQKWAVPVIFSFGFPMNILTFYIFSSTKLKYVSSAIYFAAISLADAGVLLTHFLSFLSRAHNVNVYHIYGACQVIMYINFMCVFLSIWYVTALVTEKFIGVNWPKRKAIYCTVFRAKCVITAFGILSIVCYHYLTWTVGPDPSKSHCFPYTEYGLLVAYQTLDKMDYMLVSVVPFFVIFTSSCVILFQTIRSLNTNQTPERIVQNRRPNRSRLTQDKEFKTTPAVLSLCFATFSLGIVHSVCRVFRLRDPPVLFSVASFLSMNSYSVKPFLYILSCKAFRIQLMEMFRDLACRVLQRIPWIPLNINQPSPEMHSVDQQTDGTGAVEIITEGTV